MDLPIPRINKKFRRAVAGAIADQTLYLDGKQFDELMDRLWVLDNDGLGALGAFLTRSSYKSRSLRTMIQQHVHSNPDWSAEELFEETGAWIAPTSDSPSFSKAWRPPMCVLARAQRRFVAAVNQTLKASGSELRETDSKDGYPCFSGVCPWSPVEPAEEPDFRFAGEAGP